MTTVLALLLIVIGMFFIWRVTSLGRKFRPEAEPTAPADGDTGVREPLPKRPPSMAGAVALEEPDED